MLFEESDSITIQLSNFHFKTIPILKRILKQIRSILPFAI